MISRRLLSAVTPRAISSPGAFHRIAAASKNFNALQRRWCTTAKETVPQVAKEEGAKSDWYYVGIGALGFVFIGIPSYFLVEIRYDVEMQEYFQENAPQLYELMGKYVTIDDGVPAVYKEAERPEGGK